MKVSFSLKDARKLEDMSEQEQHEEFQRLLNDPETQKRLKQLAEGLSEQKTLINQAFTKIWEQFAQPGTVAFDLYCLRAPVRGVTDKQRVQAAERIVLNLSYLVDRRRWHWVRDKLRAEGSTPMSYVKDRARSLIFLAVADLFQDPKFLQMPVTEGWNYALKVFIPRKVNNLLTEDVLGPKWRRQYEKNKKYGVTPEIPLGDPEAYLALAKPGVAELEALLDIRQRYDKSNLSPRQLELFRAWVMSGCVLKDACDSTGMKEGTGKAQLSRIKKKFNAIGE